MLEKKKNKKKIIICGVIALVLVAGIGLTYALWNYFNVSENQILVAGDIYMKFNEGNEVSITGAMPLDINNYYIEKSELNPNPSEEDVTMCVGLFTSMLNGFDDVQGFCKGTTQYQEMNLEQYLASQGLTEQFKAILPNYFVSNDYFNASPKIITYKVNTNMNNNELQACTSFFGELLGGGGSGGGPSESSYEKTSPLISDLKNNGTNSSFQPLTSGGDSSDLESFCKGTGNIDGQTFQSMIDIKILNDSQLSELKEQNIVIENVREYPTLKYFQFTIEGKNSYSKDIIYEILLQEGDEPEDRHTRLKDELLKFRLAEVVGEEEKELFTNRSYSELNNAKIYIDTIPAKTPDEIKKTYRLYMWISNDTKIGNTDDVDYNDTTWADVFASVKVSVNGDFDNKEITYDKEVATTVIKNTIGTTNGVIGLDNNSNPVTVDGDNIREYRYSGPVVNNYVYYNCEDEDNQTKDTCEIWRIVGVFKDNKGEHLKIVRNNALESSKLPESYTVDGREYSIASGMANFAYWNYPTDENYNNDWTTAGLQYYLNSESDDNGVNKGYLSYLEDYSKNMIEDQTYYLGNVTYGSVQVDTSYYSAIIDTPREAYINERGSGSCSSTSYNSCAGGHIWPGNSATWPGKVGLLYPSDFGFSASSIYWDTSLAINSFDAKAANTSWLHLTANNGGDWLLSPSSDRPDDVAYWNAGGVGSDGRVGSYYYGVRPSFNLISQAKIGPGSGLKADPYWLYGA